MFRLRSAIRQRSRFRGVGGELAPDHPPLDARTGATLEVGCDPDLNAEDGAGRRSRCREELRAAEFSEAGPPAPEVGRDLGRTRLHLLAVLPGEGASRALAGGRRFRARFLFERDERAVK